MDYLARGGIIGRFQAQEFVSAKDERRPICLACWKSLKFVKYSEIEYIWVIVHVYIHILCRAEASGGGGWGGGAERPPSKPFVGNFALLSEIFSDYFVHFCKKYCLEMKHGKLISYLSENQAKNKINAEK